MSKKGPKSRRKKNIQRQNLQKPKESTISTRPSPTQEMDRAAQKIKKTNAITKANSLAFSYSGILTLFQLTMGLVFTVIQIVLIQFQIALTNRQNNIDALYQPLEFETERGEPSGVYGNTGLTAYSTNVSIKNGSLSQVYVISYNEIEEKFMIAGSHIDPEKSIGYTITANANPEYKDTSISEPKIYDYFFLYAVAANGTRYLNCYYYVIDLENGSVEGPIQCNEIYCINISGSEPLLPYSYEQMLFRYQMLMKKINDIPYSSCGLISNNPS